jgi:P-type conjugative transfer protein TrbJ
MMRRQWCIIVGALLLGILTTKDSMGILGVGDIVFDPSVFGQSLLQVKAAYDTYSQQLRDYANQLQQYKEQLTHTAQGAQNLLSTPLNLIADMDDIYQRYQSTMNQVGAMSMQAAQAKAQFQALYTNAGSMSSTALVAKIRQMAQQQRAADQEAIRMQALREQSDTTHAAMRRALEAVRTAQGNLQVQQAQGQLAGVLGTQQQQLMEMVAASQRAATSYQAQQQTLHEIVQADAQQVMRHWSECPSCGTAFKTLPAFQ